MFVQSIVLVRSDLSTARLRLLSSSLGGTCRLDIPSQAGLSTPQLVNEAEGGNLDGSALASLKIGVRVGQISPVCPKDPRPRWEKQWDLFIVCNSLFIYVVYSVLYGVPNVSRSAAVVKVRAVGVGSLTYCILHQRPMQPRQKTLYSASEITMYRPYRRHN